MTKNRNFSGKIIAILIMAVSVDILAEAEQTMPSTASNGYYDNYHTYKQGRKPYGYTVDPWVWAYTREFADKFGMPARWIDPDLKGILAVAFRMTTIGNMICGYGDREDSCWPSLACQLDVYYDNRIRLPWVKDEITRDFFMRGVSSHEFLYDPSGLKGYRKYKPSVFPSTGWMHANGHEIWMAGGGGIIYFDREFQPGIGLIGWSGIDACPESSDTASIMFFDNKTTLEIESGRVKLRNAEPISKFELPKVFMRRANQVYKMENKPNKEVTQRLIQQFIESRKALP